LFSFTSINWIASYEELHIHAKISKANNLFLGLKNPYFSAVVTGPSWNGEIKTVSALASNTGGVASGARA